MRKLFAIALVTLALPAWAQRPVMLVTGPAPCSLGSPSCNVPVDSGGTGVFRSTPNRHYGNKVNALIKNPDILDSIGPGPPPPLPNVNGGACSVTNRLALTIPHVE